VLVTQQGIDSHFDDPLTQLMVSTQARERVVGRFAATTGPWVAMGGGGYSLDAVRRAWSMEFLIMLGAPIPAELHDVDPPEWTGDRRARVDAAVDDAVAGALDAAWT
jgi:acetoin utilization protein AcuC